MKTILLSLLLAVSAFAQTAPLVTVTSPAPSPQTVTITSVPLPAVNTAALPSYTIGTGPSWTRGATYPYSVDATLAVHIGQGQWYSWTNISTPITTTAPGAQPVASTITTGGAWIPVQSPSGSVSLLVIVQAGFSAVQATSTVAPAFTGSLGCAFRLGKSHVYLMPYAKASNPSTNTSGALATAVFQPGVQILLRVWREVMDRLDIPGIENGYKVDGVLWRGAQPSGSAWPLLAAAGCRTVIDLNNAGEAAEAQRQLAISAGLPVEFLDWSGILPPSRGEVTCALNLIRRLAAPVFVHCLHGSDRTGTLCACWRMHHDDWSFEAAMEEAFRSLGLQGMHEFWMAAAVAQYAHEREK